MYVAETDEQARDELRPHIEDFFNRFLRYPLEARLPPGYTSIVGGGANACVLHYIENKDVLKDGDLVLVDAGAEVGYYTGDITRTWPVNGRFTGHQREVYDLAVEMSKT